MDWSAVTKWFMDFSEKTNEMQSQYNAFWIANVLPNWRWWLELAMLIIPWIFWIFVRRKENTCRLLLSAFFIMAVSVFIDAMGVNMGLWLYLADLEPYNPANTSYNISMLPVTVMIFIQFFPRVKPVYKALVFAAIGAFISEPVLVWLGLYRNVHWTYLYSFPILFAEYWIAHRLTLMNSFEPLGGRS